jgi:F0F1-type ATP synthase gamma subunit
MKLKSSKHKGLLYTSNGKSVSILLSANTGLYGEITRKVFNLFIENIIKSNTDIVIVGRMGRALFDGYGYKKPYTYFELPDNTVGEGKLKEIFDNILSYSNIIVYHSLFKSILEQKPVRTFVTGEALESISTEDSSVLECIVEPTVEEVAEFFEKQILSSLFEQTLYESSLSKFASRMASLDVASENINNFIKTIGFKILKERHRELNSKQISTIAGKSLLRNN